MSLLDKYLAGENAEVYQHIESLGADAFSPENKSDVEAVLIETFQRVATNLDIIYTELKKINYRFKIQPENIYKPGNDTDNLLSQLKEEVLQFGYIPPTVQYFYKMVGGVNLTWDVENYPEIPWPLADPLEIDGLDVAAATVMQDWWKNYTRENLEDTEVAAAFLEVAADRFHKDGVDGGPPYAIELLKTPELDGRFMFERHNTSFINYLRICFENCGFPGAQLPNESFEKFRDLVRPMLKAI